jgi:hypothetical protein
MKDEGRPKPTTLSFMAVRLRQEGRDDEGAIVEGLQTADIADGDIEHLIFTLSGNNPSTHLKAHEGSPRRTIVRHLVGAVIGDHADFIAQAFGRLNAGNT